MKTVVGRWGPHGGTLGGGVASVGPIYNFVFLFFFVLYLLSQG